MHAKKSQQICPLMKIKVNNSKDTGSWLDTNKFAKSHIKQEDI